MAYSEAQKRATAKYVKENLDEIKIRVPKGEKAEMQAYAASIGKSLNSFIVEAVREKVKEAK